MEATIGLVAGSGWASGINLYAVIALLGIAGRTGWGDVPTVLERPEVIGIAAALYAVEFVADKIPYLDNLWDAVHTVIRPLGAAVLGALLTGEAETAQQALAAVGSGGLALAAHSAKATTRAAINTSPEPVSNIAVSLAEDGLVAGLVLFALREPWWALGITVALLIIGTVLMITLWRAARGAFSRARSRWADVRAHRG